MCGFLGSITDSILDEETLKKCNNRIECRGPDEKNFVTNNRYGSKNLFHNFAFNRLAIIDLSKMASQPMYSSTFNSLIMFNGEIFNHKELRKKLEKENVEFHSSHSDTETLLIGLSMYGMDFLNEINGQFSIFFFDIKNEEYFLIRDRTGQKPLYFEIQDTNFYFGSDLQSVRKLSKNNEINQNQVNNYLNLGTTVSPETFYKNIYSVNPGELINVSLKNKKFVSIKTKYWDLSKFVDDMAFQEDEFINLFEDSVNIRLESDVPLSIFLSGGLDSTSIIKAVSKKNNSINTFSMVTNSKNFNESEFMNKVVNKFESNHLFENIDLNIDFEKVKSIITKFDDIIYDPSIIPTYILSEKIAKNFKVALSGDGGDELLSGYQHYVNYFAKNKIPDKFTTIMAQMYPKRLGTGNTFLRHSSDWKKGFSSFYSDENLMKLLKLNNYSRFEDIYLTNKNKDWKSLMMVDFNFYLNEMMLKKIDRSSMLNSLEIRSPFVDHRLFEYIIGHRQFEENENFTPKRIIKKYLSEDFDSDFIDRKKMGFSIDLKKIIYKNKSEIFETINNSFLKEYADVRNIKKLTTNKSRINATRLWKVYCLSLFFENN